MYQLLRSLSGQDLVVQQAPVFVVAFVLASVFYKFGNFALECVAFLATWFVLDLLASVARTSFGRTDSVRSRA